MSRQRTRAEKEFLRRKKKREKGASSTDGTGTPQTSLSKDGIPPPDAMGENRDPNVLAPVSLADLKPPLEKPPSFLENPPVKPGLGKEAVKAGPNVKLGLGEVPSPTDKPPLPAALKPLETFEDPPGRSVTPPQEIPPSFLEEPKAKLSSRAKKRMRKALQKKALGNVASPGDKPALVRWGDKPAHESTPVEFELKLICRRDDFVIPTTGEFFRWIPIITALEIKSCR